LPLDEELFFKLSWREEFRDSEGLVIQTARDRAIRYLGDNAGDALSHVPGVKHYKDSSEFSTRHIREHLGLGIEAARVPSVLFSERLMPLEDVGPDEFSGRMWEIIRCMSRLTILSSKLYLNHSFPGHYLLWQLGVAHGGISFWNLMVRTSFDGVTHFAVLNGFDLAAIMEPGEESPWKVGFERAGTKPFMAIDLLVKNSGMIKRLYAHDLVAMIWCMVWCLEPQPRWTHGFMEDIMRDRISTSLLFNPVEPTDCAIDSDAEDLWGSVISILKVWIMSRPVAVIQ
jgi:hypothetical protein